MKGNIKVLVGIIVGIIVSSSCIVVAKTIFSSEEISYSNTSSGGSYDNVKQTLDELYERAGYQKEVYTEKILNGADPVLGEGMIPIYLDGDGNAYYANTHTAWYSYEAKKWANAVILVDDAYDKYHTGDKIKEEDIESYFVWIPRYAYKIWDLGKYDGVIEGSTLNDSDYAHSTSQASNNARIIDVEFGTNEYLINKGYKKQTRDKNTGLISDPVGIAIGNYLIHPGFILGDEELNGIWVGKFETGYNQTNKGESSITNTSSWNKAGAQQEDASSNKIIIKPNVYSWRNSSVSNMFNAAYNYNAGLGSHMMKNTEWGAVAYLSHSKYGKGAEININNNSDCITGYSALNSKQNTYPGQNGNSFSGLNDSYNSATGYLASTTGNITGVYDMSGGSWEYVAATMLNNGILFEDDQSGFKASEITNYMKLGYIDAYPSDSSIESYNKRILGDATGEMGPFYNYKDNDGTPRAHNNWYADDSFFLLLTNPWFGRGGDFSYGVLAGQFRFGKSNGGKNVSFCSRLILTGKTRTTE